jgi:hypothetical protein
MKRRGKILSVLSSAFVCLAVLAAPAVAHAAGGHGRGSATSRSRGRLTIRVVGLPPHQAAALHITGAPQRPHGARLRRDLAPRRVRTELRLAPGNYRLKVFPVAISRHHGLIDAGARATPVQRRLHVKIAPGKGRTVTVRYGSIVNPGVRDVTDAVTQVLGSPTEPSAVVLKAGVHVQHGQILSSHPTAALPHGLLAKVLSVSGKGREQVVIRGASIYEVAPSFSFDVPVTTTEGADASQLVKCSTSSSEPGASPFVHLSNFHVSGGWQTTHLGFIDVKTGATAEVHFDVSAGVSVKTSVGLKCSLNLPSVGFQGMAGPIPVYGGVRPGAEVTVGGSASLTSEGTTTVTIGAKAGAVPPKATPILGFTTPKFKVSSSVFADVTAGLSLGAEVGIGAENAANLHVDLTNGVDFTAAPGECKWDLDLGSFSATGELGPLSISTPSTPSLHKNLWHAPCGAAPTPPPPPPAPAPTPAPIVATLPLNRAVMNWNTDADVDLYTWDNLGELLYFGEREGIPYGELVNDVIPAEGETVHFPEVYRETAFPFRSYTFGICDYHRTGGPITLEVFDPDGGVRVFHQTLYGEGEGFVITTSPLGIPFVPPPGWCHYAGEFDIE